MDLADRPPPASPPAPAGPPVLSSSIEVRGPPGIFPRSLCFPERPPHLPAPGPPPTWRTGWSSTRSNSHSDEATQADPQPPLRGLCCSARGQSLSVCQTARRGREYHSHSLQSQRRGRGAAAPSPSPSSPSRLSGLLPSSGVCNYLGRM